MRASERRRAGRLSSLLASFLLAFLAPIIAPLPAAGQSGPPAPPPLNETVEPPERGPLTYEVDFDGVGDDALKDLLRRSSQLIIHQDNPPHTEGRLRRRVEGDIETFGKVLRSQGYYAGTVRYELFMDRAPIKVEFTVDKGPLYTLADYRIEYAAEPQGDWLPQGAESVGLKVGMPAEGQPIADAQVRLVRLLLERGHPIAKISGRQAFIDNEAHTLSVVVSADQGPRATYGPTLVEGLDKVEESYVLRLVNLESGRRYDQNELDQVRARLSETLLFTGIAVEPAEEVNDLGEIPILVRLTERKHRTIGGSIGYSSDEGARTEIYWRHRNFLGANEQLRLSGVVAQREQSLTANWREPHFRRLDQDLLGEAAALNRETDAFDEQSARASIALQRPFGKTWRGSAGLSVEYSLLKERGEPEEKFLLFGIPLTASRDTTDDLLDPTEGHRLGFTLTPYYGTVERNVFFLQSTALASTYYALDDDARYVLAGRGKIGSVLGATLFDLPANKRFYAGGGGSVRGFEFQTAGALNSRDDPVGGRALMELSAEMRIKITDNIGVVPFFDAGTVFDRPFPDTFDDLFYAAGIGGRYYTGFGPIRLDVAFPLNPRDRDDWFQFYVSIGQAF